MTDDGISDVEWIKVGPEICDLFTGLLWLRLGLRCCCCILGDDMVDDDEFIDDGEEEEIPRCCWTIGVAGDRDEGVKLLVGDTAFIIIISGALLLPPPRREDDFSKWLGMTGEGLGETSADGRG